MITLNKFVDRLEKRFQLDLRYYIKNTFLLVVSRGVVLGCGLLLSILFARLLSKEIFGQYNFIFAVLGILSIFTLTGMGTAIVQAVANGHDRVLITGTKEKFKWCILGSIAAFGVGIYYFLTGSPVLGKCFMISSLFLPFINNFQTFHAFLAGKNQFDKVAKYQNITAVLSLLVVALVIYFSGDLIHILIASLLTSSLLGGYFFGLTLRKIESQSNDRDTISFGKHLSLMNAVSTIAGQADKIIIGTLLGFSDLAVYSIASAVPGSIRTTISPISRVTLPKLSTMNEKDAYSAVKKRYVYLILLAAIVSGIMILLCPYIFPLLYSQKYVDSVLYAQILFVGMIFAIPTQILGKALFPSQREIGKLYRFRIMYSIVELILLFALVLNFGLLGAVFARLLGDMFAMVYSLRLATWV
jgi:O-antigen/teichoic acid export membrane protein